MHGTTGANAPLANIKIQMAKGSDVVDNQAGFFVSQRLRDRIGTSSEGAPYTLQIKPRYTRRRLGLTSADVASRYDISVSAGWELVDSKTGATLSKGASTSTVTFGAPEGPYGVITADNVGVEQSAKETADKLILQLARYFAAENKKAKK
jgi:LPS-assembly lipoprotein